MCVLIEFMKAQCLHISHISSPLSVQQRLSVFERIPLCVGCSFKQGGKEGAGRELRTVEEQPMSICNYDSPCFPCIKDQKISPSFFPLFHFHFWTEGFQKDIITELTTALCRRNHKANAPEDRVSLFIVFLWRSHTFFLLAFVLQCFEDTPSHFPSLNIRVTHQYLPPSTK